MNIELDRKNSSLILPKLTGNSLALLQARIRPLRREPHKGLRFVSSHDYGAESINWVPLDREANKPSGLRVIARIHTLHPCYDQGHFAFEPRVADAFVQTPARYLAKAVAVSVDLAPGVGETQDMGLGRKMHRAVTTLYGNKEG